MKNLPFTESTLELLALAKAGDRAALERLFGCQLQALRRWVSGRVPPRARHVIDADDLVQEAATNTFRRLEQIEPRHEEALQAYLRRAVTNLIRDRLRQVRRSIVTDQVAQEAVSSTPSPLEVTIGREQAARYKTALLRLRADERRAIIARIEGQLSYQELADLLGKPSPDAARMFVTRAIRRLAVEMHASHRRG